MTDLLFEIGAEEIPAGFVERALDELVDGLRQGLVENELAPQEIKRCGTPRRLTVFVKGIPEFQKDRVVEVLGPSASVAFDDSGKPTKAAAGFARAQGIDVKALQVVETPKGRYVCTRRVVEGKAAYEVLKRVLPGCVEGLTFPKSMRWESSGKMFARPIRWILAILGKRVVEFEFAGVKSGRTTYGHPFLSRDPVLMDEADLGRYVDELRRKYVVADIDERRELIRSGLTELLKKHDAEFHEEELLGEVVHLVEFPGVIEGRFEERYLDVPLEVLVEAMKEHQRYFPVIGRDGKIRPVFLVVANRPEEFGDVIRQGNERVLRARLEDARFFYHEDMKLSLEERARGLRDTVYLAGLGSYLDKTERLMTSAPAIAGAVGCGESVAHEARRAAML